MIVIRGSQTLMLMFEKLVTCEMKKLMNPSFIHDHNGNVLHMLIFSSDITVVHASLKSNLYFREKQHLLLSVVSEGAKTK